MQANAIHARRSMLRDSVECKFVDSDEFCELLLGFRRLVRADETSVDLLGLLDLDTGTRFFIEQEKLAPLSVLRSQRACVQTVGTA